MKNRPMIVFLLLAIAALALVEWFLTANGRKKALATRAFLVDGAKDYTTIVVERRGEPTTVLEKGADAWALKRPFASEVEEANVLRLLDALAQTPISESTTENEMLRRGYTLERFGLEDPRLRVTLSNETSVASVAFGGPTAASADGVYARTGDDRAVLIVPVSVLAAVDQPADQLRRRRVFHNEAESVASFDVRQSANSILSFRRDGEGWRLGPADKAVTERVTKFLDALVAAEAKTFVWPQGAANENAQASASLLAGYGLDPETAVTVTLKRSGGDAEAISFGKAADDAGFVYAYVLRGGAIVTVPSALKDAATQDATSFVDARLFRAAPEKVGALTLTDGDTTLAATRDEKGRWQLVAPIAAPADDEEMDALLGRVLALTSAELDAKGVGVSVGGTDAKPVAVSRAALFPKGGGFESLRSRDVVDFEANEIKRLVATATAAGTNAVATSVVYARERKAWSVEKAPEGAVVSADGVARVVKALAPLKATRVVRLKVLATELAAFGLDEPAFCLAVDLDRENAVRRNILIGAETTDGVFATVGAADAVFVLSREARDALVAPLVK